MTFKTMDEGKIRRKTNQTKLYSNVELIFNIETRKCSKGRMIDERRDSPGDETLSTLRPLMFKPSASVNTVDL